MQDDRKTVLRIPYVSVTSLKQNFIILLKFPHVQTAFLKFTSCDNQALVGFIPIAVHLNLKS